MGKKTAPVTPADDTIEFAQPEEPLDVAPTSHRRPTRAILAAGAVASTLAATAAYRRRRAQVQAPASPARTP